MPKTKKFEKLLKNTNLIYGKKKGRSIAYAIARKNNWKV